jgi:N-acetylglucosaminyldiphosphoundecaprenol N-acetyl-beta-D-mannosaminyltransferase
LETSVTVYVKTLFLTWLWLEVSSFVFSNFKIPPFFQRLYGQGNLDCLVLYIILYSFFRGTQVETYLHIIFPVYLLFDLGIKRKETKIQVFFWLEVAVITLLVLSGLTITFVSNFEGGMFFFDRSVFYVSFFWLMFIVSLVNLFNVVDGLLCGITAVLAHSFLVGIFLQPRVDSSALPFALVLGAFATLIWLFTVLREKRGVNSVVLSSILATLVGVASIISTSKGIALMSIGMTLGLFAVPILVFAFIIFFTHFQYKLGPRDLAGRHQVLWRFSTSSVNAFVVLASLTLIFIMMVTLLFQNKLWSAGLVCFALMMFARLARQIFIKRKIRYKDVFFPHEDHVMLFGTRIFRGRKERALELVDQVLKTKPLVPEHLVTPDALCLFRTVREPYFGRILSRAFMAVPDGAGVLWASIFLKERPILERIPGVDFMQSVCGLAEREGYGVFFLGSRQDHLEQALGKLRSAHPRLVISGSHDGYFCEADEGKIVEEINASGARILFLALGVPLQEYWVDRHRRKLKVHLVMGIGGSLDVLAGKVQRSPLFFQEYGLEWLYRTLREPWRLTRVLSLPLYILLVLREKLRQGDEEHERNLAPPD